MALEDQISTFSLYSRNQLDKIFLWMHDLQQASEFLQDDEKESSAFMIRKAMRNFWVELSPKLEEVVQVVEKVQNDRYDDLEFEQLLIRKEFSGWRFTVW